MANNGTLYTVVQLIEYFEPSRTGVFYTDPAGDGSIQFNFGDGLDITTNGALAIGFISQALSDAGALPATIDTIVGDLNAYVSDNSLVTNNASELVSKLINLIMGLGIDVAELEQTVTGLYLQYESATKFNGIFSSIYPIPANVLSVVEDLVYTGGPGRIGASGIPGLNTALESANWGAAAYAIESDPVAQNYVDVPEGGYGLIYRRDAEAMIMLGFQVSLNGDNTINNISPIAVNNAAVVQYQQLFAANVPDSLDTTNNATIQSQIISYLSTQAYYVPQTSDGTTEPDIVASIISQFSSVMPSGITATTIENINSVFSDTSYTTGGLVHIPLASMSVSSITNLPLLPHGQTYVFDAATSMVYTLGASIDGSNSNALILDTQNPEGTYPAFDAGTYSNISYNSSTNTVGVTLVDDCGDPLGTLAFNTASGADTFTANDGYVITLPSTDTMHFTKINSDPLQGLINYISNLYDATQLEENDFNFLNPTGSAYTVTGTVSGGNDLFTLTANTPGAGITGDATKNNILYIDPATVDLASDTISDLQELDTEGGNVTLTNAQFNGFSTITGGGVITAADSGTFDLTAGNVSQSADFSSLTASDLLGTTLIGNGVAGQTLTASILGNDTLIAGSGAGDTLIAGAGVDTLEGGTGGDAFIAAGAYGTFFAATGLGGSVTYDPSPLAAGSVIQGQGTGNSLEVNGDITGVSISGIQTLITGETYGFTDEGASTGLTSDTSITLTNAQWNGFSALTDIALGTDGSFTINAANDNAEMLGVLLRRAA